LSSLIKDISVGAVTMRSVQIDDDLWRSADVGLQFNHCSYDQS